MANFVPSRRGRLGQGPARVPEQAAPPHPGTSQLALLRQVPSQPPANTGISHEAPAILTPCRTSSRPRTWQGSVKRRRRSEVASRSGPQPTAGRACCERRRARPGHLGHFAAYRPYASLPVWRAHAHAHTRAYGRYGGKCPKCPGGPGRPRRRERDPAAPGGRGRPGPPCRRPGSSRRAAGAAPRPQRSRFAASHEPVNRPSRAVVQG